ncbi:hypothetical protein M2336_002780 [Sphingobium sp. B1D7B]|uniref:hypothetical protein n=1 Tax=Sphingobium sp. B1D7B TaxID=2940578 RepID=UPI0022244104|nr:hypothetical protein [Sphingobium sp. B1D7B]MCW2406151.1 hypothetical protein [Sphingobium sp. B1D7B]
MSSVRGKQVIDTGVAWYKRADYPRILEIVADPELLPATFDQWQELAEQLERQVARSGGRLIRVDLNPKKFIAWCAANGHNLDARGRMAFAADPRNWPMEKAN